MASQASPGKVKKLGTVGRKRRYETPGIEDVPPVKDVVLFRYKMGRHYPGLSQDMQDWYEHYYFTKPSKAEKAKDAKEYERHVKSYSRGRRWIAEEEGIAPVGNSGTVVPFRRASGER